MMKMELKDSNQVDMFGPNYEKKKNKQTVYRSQKWFAYVL